MSDLGEFFRRKKEQEAEWQRERTEILKEWLGELVELRNRLLYWLRPAISAGVKVKLPQIEISEEILGTYKAPALEIAFGLRRALIRPVARIIVGGQGRVDIESPLGNFLLIRRSPEAGWFLIRKSWDDAKPLTEEVFADLIKDIFS